MKKPVGVRGVKGGRKKRLGFLMGNHEMRGKERRAEKGGVGGEEKKEGERAKGKEERIEVGGVRVIVCIKLILSVFV